MTDKRLTKQFTQAILLGLNSIPKPGVPGQVLAFGGSQTFCPLITKTRGCPIGASEFGSGRVIAFGHNGFLQGVHNDDDYGRRLARLVRNSVVWGAKAECEFYSSHNLTQELQCGPYCDSGDAPHISTSLFSSYPFGAGTCRLPIAIGGIGFNDAKLKQIVSAISTGSNDKFVAVATVPRSTKAEIDKLLKQNLDVILWTNTNSREEVTDAVDILDPRAERLLHFVMQGGAVIVAVCPWGWDSLSGGTNLETRCVFNHFLESVGLLYTGDYAGGDVNGQYQVDTSPTPTPPVGENVHTAAMLLSQRQAVPKPQLRRSVEAIADLPGVCFAPERAKRSATLGPLTQQLEVVRDVALLRDVVSTYGAGSLKWPLTLSEEIDFTQSAAFLFVPWFHRWWQTASPQQCPKAPALTHPGDVLPSTPRLSNYLFTLNPALAQWQSTGVYVPPGEVLYITLSDQALVAHPSIHLVVRVGSHSDTIRIFAEDNDRHKLERWPKLSITRSWKPEVAGVPDNWAFSSASPPSKQSALAVASPYGGLLYIEIIGDVPGAATGVPLTLSIDGGVLAPHYHLELATGQIPYTEWTLSYPHGKKPFAQLVEESGAPWGEIEGKYMIVTMTRDALKHVKDPAGVAEYYDKIVAHELALAGQQLQKKERYVMDKQISAGWLHSGYPIMGHLDGLQLTTNGVPKAADLEALYANPSWGIYHELGHNRQKGEWTWRGLTEVTVNIFSLYVTQMINGKTPFQSIYFRESCRHNGLDYLKGNKDFEYWSGQYNVALSTYVVLIEHYGWHFMADVFRAYEKMAKKPNTDHDKIQEWIRQTSKRAGVDLRPFYQQWRWPIDNKALSELDKYPKYNHNVLEIMQNS
eukprot:Blabericola_migrator_1__3544@NODE_2051_length_3358_cov_40_919781_g1301_i0_p1_GENE_NODE_2051_length_3358_cov_40_919781_g1301_i0NODE_2051_length_3358_cov_40_919781_g1301_i0_p1_ORF_typecomplete_len863_score172_28Peptidase_M60/PF13402_6/1_1e60M60like_N/PF17291_2/1_4e13zflike/PF04071_12/2_2e03zflike/PF04071_12/1_2_NODE_2051_length_3358_cov_40_919781_g1301_i06213209